MKRNACYETSPATHCRKRGYFVRASSQATRVSNTSGHRFLCLESIGITLKRHQMHQRVARHGCKLGRPRVVDHAATDNEPISFELVNAFDGLVVVEHLEGELLGLGRGI